MKIALLEPLGISPEKTEELASPLKDAGHTFIRYDSRSTEPDELLRRSEDCEMVIIANTSYPEHVIDALPKLKMINVAFTGIDHIGLNACRRNGVQVCNAAGYSGPAVAELVIGMVIDLYRKLGKGNTAVRNAGTSAGLMGKEIHGKTVGIIGTGDIGLKTAALFKAFGAQVIAYSRSEKAEAVSMGIRYVSLDELMKQSDIISVHVPNNAMTRGMIGKEQIALMKKTAVIVNCARGPVVDSGALAEALKAQSIAGAAVDVFNTEPPIAADEPILSAPNTLLMPHVGFLTQESMERRAEIVFDNAIAYVKGTPKNLCSLV